MEPSNPITTTTSTPSRTKRHTSKPTTRSVGSSSTLPPSPASFCGKFSEQIAGGLFQAKHLVRDPNTSALATVWICDECVARMAQILAEESPGTQWMRGWQFWSRRGRAPNVP
jgi:hypothetical protein